MGACLSPLTTSPPPHLPTSPCPLPPVLPPRMTTRSRDRCREAGVAAACPYVSWQWTARCDAGIEGVSCRSSLSMSPGHGKVRCGQGKVASRCNEWQAVRGGRGRSRLTHLGCHNRWCLQWQSRSSQPRTASPHASLPRSPPWDPQRDSPVSSSHSHGTGLPLPRSH